MKSKYIRFFISTLLFFSLTIMFMAFSSSAEAGGGEGWEVDFKKASELAKKENKFMLLDFTGSDWCYYCKKLNKDVFIKQQFKDFTSQEMVLVEIDFPQKKLSDEQTKQNNLLLEKYGVSGFPTIVILNPEGKEVDRHTGYRAGGVESYVDFLKKVIAKNKTN